MKQLLILLLATCLLMGCRQETKMGTSKEEYIEDVVTETPVLKEDDREEIATEEVVAEEIATEEVVEELETEEVTSGVVLTEERCSQIEAALTAGDFSGAPVILEEVTAYLEQLGIRYEGFYTARERVDIVLEDGTALLFLTTENQDMVPFGYELMMVNEWFNEWSFQENYYHAYDVNYDQYYYPELSERVWSEEDINGFNKTDLSIARNELFAKYGRVFEDPFLKNVFGVKSWYEPRYTAEEFGNLWQELLTDIEKENLRTILAYEEVRRWRGKEQGTGKVKELVSGSFIDLDGDSKKEQVTYESKKDMLYEEWGTEEISVFVITKDNESTILLNGEDGYLFHEKCYLVSLDEKTHFLVVLDYGPSADYVSIFYRWNEEKLTEVGRMYAHTEDLKIYKEYILAPTETVHLQCQPVDYVYRWQGSEFVYEPSEYYEYRKNTVTALREFPLFAEKGDTEPFMCLEEGTQVKIMGGDLKEWVLLEVVNAGERGWLKVDENSNIWIGEEQFISCYENAFEGLYFYG